MCQLLRRLWQEERGTVLVAEWALVASVLILGCVAGLLAARWPSFTEQELGTATIQEQVNTLQGEE
jgi:hypothetical protein